MAEVARAGEHARMSVTPCPVLPLVTCSLVVVRVCCARWCMCGVPASCMRCEPSESAVRWQNVKREEAEMALTACQAQVRLHAPSMLEPLHACTSFELHRKGPLRRSGLSYILYTHKHTHT